MQRGKPSARKESVWKEYSLGRLAPTVTLSAALFSLLREYFLTLFSCLVHTCFRLFLVSLIANIQDNSVGPQLAVVQLKVFPRKCLAKRSELSRSLIALTSFIFWALFLQLHLTSKNHSHCLRHQGERTRTRRIKDDTCSKQPKCCSAVASSSLRIVSSSHCASWRIDYQFSLQKTASLIFSFMIRSEVTGNVWLLFQFPILYILLVVKCYQLTSTEGT